MNEIISDATPLITFARIGQLSLLQKIVGTLVIPTAVADEISVYTLITTRGYRLTATTMDHHRIPCL